MSIQPKFAHGQFAITPGAREAFAAIGQSISPYLDRHLAGDWGELDAHDRQANETALQADEYGEYDRLLSAYTLSDGTRIWIITEADRSATTILLPSEY